MNHLEPFAVNVIQACRLTGLGRSKLYELLADGEISSFKVGKRRLIRLASLRAWIDRFAEHGGDVWPGGPVREQDRTDPVSAVRG